MAGAKRPTGRKKTAARRASSPASSHTLRHVRTSSGLGSEEAARRLGITAAELRRRARAGTIPATLDERGRYRFAERSIAAREPPPRSRSTKKKLLGSKKRRPVTKKTLPAKKRRRPALAATAAAAERARPSRPSPSPPPRPHPAIRPRRRARHSSRAPRSGNAKPASSPKPPRSALARRRSPEGPRRSRPSVRSG